jgi:hypothetical protein
MKLFGHNFGKEKAASFPEFRDMVRLALRRQHPDSTVENTETGIIFGRDGRKQACNLRSLFMEYTKNPKDKDAQIVRWIMALVVDVPEHGWIDAQITLRPTLKHMNNFIAVAQATMQKADPPDNLPHAPFVGDLGVIIMRDLPGTAVGVTQSNLDAWTVTFEEAMQAAIMNMNMLTFPIVTNALVAGGTGKRTGQEEVGIVFEGDHLTASWLVIDRFRDYITQRLEGDYVVFVPIRSRLVAIRADEAGLIMQMQQNNRSYSTQNYALTTQCYHVSGAMTGGVVTIYQGGSLNAERTTLDAASPFAKGAAPMLPTPGIQPATSRQGPVDLSSWGGLSESTLPDAPKVRTPYDQAKR